MSLDRFYFVNLQTKRPLTGVSSVLVLQSLFTRLLFLSGYVFRPVLISSNEETLGVSLIL